ncbi:MAG: hypothetical protein ACOC95_09600, partial [Planctomycetota bacterium]
DGPERVKAIVRSCAGRIQTNNVFFGPAIPAKKLPEHLRERRASERRSALIDNTAFGGAKDGAVLTSTALYAHNRGEAPQRLDFSQITSVAFTEGLTSVPHVNDRKVLVIVSRRSSSTARRRHSKHGLR